MIELTQQPQQLALLLLHHDQGWSEANIDQALQNDDNHVRLKTHIPVYITYFTLKVNDDGSISTFGDIYGHDARMAAGQDPEPLDKDFVRRYYTALDYRGDGDAPPLPNDVRVGAAKRYIEAYERITGQEFIPNTEPPVERIRKNLGLSS